MAKGFFDMLLDEIFDADWKGRRGEKLTERELKLVGFLGRKGKILRNIYVPKEKGETTEIDVVYITRKGIFVIESKNYSGWIFGDEKAAYWTAMLPNKEKNRFYNPVKQNRTHLKWLGKYVGEEVPLFSLIVFSERCELKKVTVNSPEIKVIKRDRLYAAVRSIWDTVGDKLSEEQVNEIYGMLQKMTDVDQAVKEAHVKNINAKYKKTDVAETALQEDISEPTAQSQEAEGSNMQKAEEAQRAAKIPEPEAEELLCPRCGNKLVLRTAKKGTNAGNQFYGCSGFPKCRYIQNL